MWRAGNRTGGSNPPISAIDLFKIFWIGIQLFDVSNIGGEGGGVDFFGQNFVDQFFGS